MNRFSYAKRVAAGFVAVILATILSAGAADGTWTYNGNDNWSTTNRWSGNIVADGAGFTATFGNVFSANSTVTNDSDRTIGNIVFSETGQNIDIAGTNTLTLDGGGGAPVVNATGGSGRSYTISAPVISTNGLTKNGNANAKITNPNTVFSGSGSVIVNQAILTFGSFTNTSTGGTIINPTGTLAVGFDPSLGAPGVPITLNGGTLDVSSANWTNTHPIILNAATNFINKPGNGTWTCAGAVTGANTNALSVRYSGSPSDCHYTSLANTFTGEFVLDSSGGERSSQYWTSFKDAPGAGNIVYTAHVANDNNTPAFVWQTTATNALVLNYRRIEFRLDGNMEVVELRNANASHPIIINTDFLVSGNGQKFFSFNAGSSAVTNTISGSINDGTNGATVHFTKSGAGALVLSGNNSNSGTNTLAGGTLVLAGSNTCTGVTMVSGGTLVLEGGASLRDDGTLNMTGGKVAVKTFETVGSLQFAGVGQAMGTWGSSTSGAYHTNDTYFTGPGQLIVGMPEAPGTMIFGK